MTREGGSGVGTGRGDPVHADAVASTAARRTSHSRPAWFGSFLPTRRQSTDVPQAMPGAPLTFDAFFEAEKDRLLRVLCFITAREKHRGRGCGPCRWARE